MEGGTLCPRSPSLALVLEVLEEQGAARRQGSCFTVSLPGGSPSRIVWEALERLVVGGGASASEHLPQGPEPMRAAFRILALGGACPGRWFSLELAVPLGEALDTLHVAEALALAEVLRPRAPTPRSCGRTRCWPGAPRS